MLIVAKDRGNVQGAYNLSHPVKEINTVLIVTKDRVKNLVKTLNICFDKNQSYYFLRISIVLTLNKSLIPRPTPNPKHNPNPK